MAAAKEPPRAGPTVYVVDDDDGMRNALSTLLSTVGYTTAVYARAQDFLQRFKAEEPGWAPVCE